MRLSILLATALISAVSMAGCMGSNPDDKETNSVIVEMKDVRFQPVTITIAPGTTVLWKNFDAFGHTVTPTDKAQWGTQGSGDDSSQWIAQGESWSFTFAEPGTYSYYCIPHASQDPETQQWRGMVGTVIVEAGATPSMSRTMMEPDPALPVDVTEIGRNAADVPASVGERSPTHLTYDITAKEVIAEIADGTTYEYWTFDGTVPGPMLRAREGDTITVRLHNDESSIHAHNIDFHAVTGPGGGAPMLVANPGETATFTFKALNSGLYIYHCAYQDPPLHIAHGMYGLILIEPAGGLPPVDREFYVVQGDFYGPFKASQKGHHEYDGDRADAENPTFVVFNGRVGSLQGDRQLAAEVGQTVRLFLGVGGPNLVSSFHVIGEIFDRVWDQASLTTPPLENVQTTLVPAGGAAIIEFKVEVPGDYFLVDHSINRIHKGAFAVLHVDGEGNPEVYRGGS